MTNPYKPTEKRFWFDVKVNPFGNYDDKPNELFLAKWPALIRKIEWYRRNPLHNFLFHWIGAAGKVIRYEGPFLDETVRGIATRYVYTSDKRYWCKSYRGKHIEWYWGMRRNGGFGATLRLSKAKLDDGTIP